MFFVLIVALFASVLGFLGCFFVGISRDARANLTHVVEVVRTSEHIHAADENRPIRKLA